MWAMPGLFKSLTNFSLIKFEELAQLMVPTIIGILIKFVSYGTIQPIRVGLMGGRRCIA
jgi:hypothetical protein